MGTFTDQTPQAFFDEPPEAADVVIIGGGVIGVSAALFLAERGQKVALCEKGRVAGEQSSRNWGWVRQLNRDADELPIMMESNRIWRGLAERCGEDLGFRAEGVLYLYESEERMAGGEAFLEIACPHQLEVRRLSAREVSNLVQAAPGLWKGGLFCPGDGRAEPWIAVPVLARAAQREGVAVIENCAVRALDLAGGKVAGVVTEKGRIRCQRVLLAGGAWSSLFARNAGITLPQLTVRATVARTTPGPEVFAGNAADARLAFRRRQDGGYTLAVTDNHDHFLGPDSFRFALPFRHTLRDSWAHTTLKPAAPRGFPDAWRTPRTWEADEASPFERMRVLNPPPAPGSAETLKRRMDERLPALRGLAIADVWAGMIDATPDVVPYMDAVPSPEGLFIATGFSGHGFGIGPAAGRVMADLILGRDPGHDMRRFRFGRFSDGSPIRPGPSL